MDSWLCVCVVSQETIVEIQCVITSTDDRVTDTVWWLHIHRTLCWYQLYRDLSQEEAVAHLDAGEWHYTTKIKLRGVEYHSSRYTRAPRSNSYTVSFWHAIPNNPDDDSDSSVEHVIHYATIHYFLYLSYEGSNSLYALVTCHTAVAEEDVPVALKASRLAYVKGTRRCFIPATAIISHVLFIKNRSLPEVGLLNKKPMFVSQDLDHTYDFE